LVSSGAAREVVLNTEAANRFLIIGTGSIGRRHIDNLRKMAPFSEFAFVRADAREDEYSRELGATVFANVQAGIDWSPDLAVIATPSNLHGDALFPLLCAQVPTFVEKPVVVDHGECELLTQFDPKALPPTQVGCVLRFLEPVVLLKQWLETGRLGRIVRARFECGQYLPDWRPEIDYRDSYSASRARGGGVIFDLVHELDLAVMLFGACKLEHVMAGHRSGLEIDSEDVALIHLRGPDELPIEVALDYVSRRPVRRINIVGDRATAVLDFIERKLKMECHESGVSMADTRFELDAAYRLQLAELFIASQGKGITRLPLHEGLKATRLAIAARDWDRQEQHQA
jgi:predicted dehydrogenase